MVHGRVTLSSGREADHYVDLRRITLHGRAAPLVGEVMLELAEQAPREVEAVGGLTLGADPVATAMLHAAAARGRRLDAFVVRKESKAHGLQRRIEGPDVAGRPVLAVEDTSTTGGSVLAAVQALREAGADVVARRRDRRPGDRCPRSGRGRGTALPGRLLAGRAGALTPGRGSFAAGPRSWPAHAGPRSRSGTTETATMASRIISTLFRTSGTWPSPAPSRVTPVAHSSGADPAVDEVPPPVHLGDAGHHGDERAHDRHEPGQHDRPVAVLVEELVGLVDVLEPEQARVRAGGTSPVRPTRPIW